jgi:hypothetical protein
MGEQDDSLVLEDESGRISLIGAPIQTAVSQLVTGVVLAVRGTVDDLGLFTVRTGTALLYYVFLGIVVVVAVAAAVVIAVIRVCLLFAARVWVTVWVFVLFTCVFCFVQCCTLLCSLGYSSIFIFCWIMCYNAGK